MSMRALSFRCTQCEFGASSRVAWGKFNYTFSDETVPVQRDLGWCNDCQTIRPTEVLPIPDELERLQKEHTQMCMVLERSMKELRQEQSWLFRVLKFNPRLPPELQEMKFEIDYLSDRISSDTKLGEILVGRVSGPRCLLCSTENIAPLPQLPNFPYFNDGDSETVTIPFTHPRCGGQLTVYMPAIRWTITMKERAYDREGRLLI